MSQAPVVQPMSVTAARVTWAVLLLMPLSVLITAAFLTPDPHGLGTHTQLGLPPCGFYLWTGLPCPGCGLTTCFTYMVRGQFIAGAHANAFGVLLFLTTVASLPVSAIGFVRGWPVMPMLERFYVDRLALLLATISLTVWLVRIVTTVALR